MPGTQTTWRQHYTQAALSGNEGSQRLLDEELEVPEELEYVYEWFVELGRARGSGGFGPSPISYQDIAAWAQLTRRDPDAFEVRCIKDLDLCYLASIHEADKDNKKR